MSGYTIHLPEEDNIVLSAPVVRRLLAAGNGDAALLYLALLENRGSLAPEKLMESLKWDRRRLSAAEESLLRQGLISAPTAAEEKISPVPWNEASRRRWK